MAEPETAPADKAKDWSKVLVLASGAIKAGEKRPVIVVERRDPKGALMAVDYPKGQDLYYRTHGGYDAGIVHEKHKGEEGAAFPEGADVLTLGENVEQGLTQGLSYTPGIIHVGPASPAYGAVNLAHLKFREQQTAADKPTTDLQEIEIQGLAKAEQAALQPWFALLPTWRPPGFPPEVWPPANIRVTFT